MSTRKSRPIGVGVIGLGLMGRTHIEAYRAADAAGHPCRLVAVCDGDPARLDGRAPSGGNLVRGHATRLFDPREVLAVTDSAQLLAHPGVDLVSICTHTDSHASLALQALAAGKHVLCEKPLALRSSAVAPMVAAARKARRLLVPALCMRFWPGWDWLAECVRTSRFGAVRSAVFQRLASPPSWARGFYADRARSGGALVDLHIHDADFVRHLFGNPIQVDSSGDPDHVTTLYRFANGPQHVVAEGGWDHHAPWPFLMRYTVIFERATASFDVQREPKLLVYRADRAEPVELPELTGYDGEIRHVLDLVAGSKVPARASAADGYAVARLLEAEQRSAATRRPVRLRAGALPPGTFMGARAARRRRSPRAGGR